MGEPGPAWFVGALESEPAVDVLSHDGVDIATRTWGGGALPPVVLVHGGGAHSRWWDHIAPLLAVDRLVVALDLAGHGDSGRRPGYSFESWAGDVLAVIRSTGERPVVVGHSLGGMVSLVLAQTTASRIGGLVLLDSVVGAPTSDRADPGSFIASGPTRRYGTEAHAVARWRPVPFQDCAPWILEHVAATSVRRYEDGWSWKFDSRVFGQEIFLPLPEEPVACRSAFVRAEHGLVSEQAAQRTADAMGAVAVATVPDAGHHLMLDQPLALVSALLALLRAWGD